MQEDENVEEDSCVRSKEDDVQSETKQRCSGTKEKMGVGKRTSLQRIKNYSWVAPCKRREAAARTRVRNRRKEMAEVKYLKVSPLSRMQATHS